jgi:nucleotide-binding universal stress UspA family protein
MWRRDQRRNEVSEIADSRPRIVVGVDGSDPSKQALRWAARIGAAEGARIEAVMAWQLPTLAYRSIGPVVDMQEATEKALMEAVDDVFGEQRPDGMMLRTIQGGGAPVLLDASRDALMVVVGSRGRGGFAGLLLGSVSAKLAEHAECPVLVVR